LLREVGKQIDMGAYVPTDSAVIEALRDASARAEKVRVWRDASGAACCSKSRAIRSLVSALVERNGRLDAIKPDRTGRRQSRFPRCPRNEASGSVLDHVAQRRSLKPLGERDA
jgi:hypothetical protein